MPLQVATQEVKTFDEKTGLTAGNEYVFKIPQNRKVIFTADADSDSALANIAFSLTSRNTITSLDDFDIAFDTDQEGSIATSAETGILHIALKITSGTWRCRVKVINALY